MSRFAVCVKWVDSMGSTVTWANSSLFTCGRNFDMHPHLKDRLPTMITTEEDPYDNTVEDIARAAEEAYAYLLEAPGTIAHVYCLMVTEEDIERAKARVMDMAAFHAELARRVEADVQALQAKQMPRAAKKAVRAVDKTAEKAARSEEKAVDKAAKKAATAEDKAARKAAEKAAAQKAAEEKKAAAQKAAEEKKAAEDKAAEEKRARLESDIVRS